MLSMMMMTGCNQAVFSKQELAMIREAGGDVPFRVLETTNEGDALVLRATGKELKGFARDTDFQAFIERLKVTLVEEEGVGIAAPQVGILKNVFLFVRTGRGGGEVVTVVNPEIVRRPDETVCFEGDGCLSVPEATGNTARYPWIEVEYYNEAGALVREWLEGYSRETGFDAVVFQHEYDHLKGILFTDRLCEEQPEATDSLD